MHFAMQRFDLLFPDYSARNHSEPSKGRKGEAPNSSCSTKGLQREEKGLHSRPSSEEGKKSLDRIFQVAGCQEDNNL